MSKLTVFTPTYNREELLPRLYHSLCMQTNMNFEWIVVDDGSTDNTEKLIKTWIDENVINIVYYKQSNSGKMAAHNKGVELTKTQLFFCVDSDDQLTERAVEMILEHWENVKSNDKITGIVAYKQYEDGKALTSIGNKIVEKFRLKDGYDLYGLNGDTALIFRTAILKNLSFPVYKGEKFVPESYLYDQVDQKGELSVMRKAVYLVEYQENGYSANIARNLYKNPKGYFDFINQRIQIDRDLKNKYLDSARYVAMSIAHRKKHVVKASVNPIYTIAAYPLGILLYIQKYAKFVNEVEE